MFHKLYSRSGTTSQEVTAILDVLQPVSPSAMRNSSLKDGGSMSHSRYDA